MSTINSDVLHEIATLREYLDDEDLISMPPLGLTGTQVREAIAELERVRSQLAQSESEQK